MKFIKNKYSSTAILLFAQSEKVEGIVKPIVCLKKQNDLLWKKMNDSALRNIQKTNIPYFISDENNQQGDCFGSKIAHAIHNIFDKGFEKVIVIGNDCLELQPKDLLEANHKLQTKDIVLGPDFNGGTYLIGVSKSSFNTKDFSAVSWQTALVFKELQTLFNKCSVALLPKLNDCNSTSDFKKAVHKLSYSNPLRIFIDSIFHNRTIISHYSTFLITQRYSNLNFNKGSPVQI